MAHFAQLNENNEVIWVTPVSNDIVTDENGNDIEQRGIDHILDTIPWAKDYQWKQTSYNCNFRGYYAGIGFLYNEDLDAFVPPKRFDSWELRAIDEDLKRYGWHPPSNAEEPILTQEQENLGYYYEWDDEAYKRGDYENAWVLRNGLINT